MSCSYVAGRKVAVQGAKHEVQQACTETHWVNIPCHYLKERKQSAAIHGTNM